LPDTPRESAEDRSDGPDRPERRDFLTRIGVGACAVAAVGSGVVTLDFMKPKVLFEPPTTFRAGDPGDYTEGTIRFNKEKKAYVCGGPGGVYALSAVCTHMRCILNYDRERRGLVCPCHDGRFDLSGNVISGPPPRPLPLYEVMTRAGEVFVRV